MDRRAKSEPVVTFRVYGFHIGCQTATALRKDGYDARYMAGAHFAWKAAKGPTRLFDPQTATGAGGSQGWASAAQA
jgi:hypothetical protein